jgi:prepilin-type N-terminal cleavage/methylation domain-containing protein
MTRATHRAFSLIEVLIAILVLGLGLLGLGAVFPAVITEQRRSFDSISGESVARQVEDLLRADNELVDLAPLRGPEFGGIQGAVEDGAARPSPINAGASFDFLWVMDRFVRIDGGANTPWDGAVPGAAGMGDLFDGTWRADSGDNEDAQILPISARLHPLPTSGSDPKFVWDVIARRHPSGPTQFAVFVRRIDDRIAAPAGQTLGQAFLDPAANQRPLPLAIDINTGRLQTPVPGATNQAYPAPQSLDAYADDRQPTWLILRSEGNSTTDTSIGFVRRVGQQFVDNTGVVRTVIGLPQPRSSEPLAGLASQAVIVSPAFTPTESSNGAVVQARPGQAREQVRRRASWVRQIVFTPQPPVAVRVFTLDKE